MKKNENGITSLTLERKQKEQNRMNGKTKERRKNERKANTRTK